MIALELLADEHRRLLVDHFDVDDPPARLGPEQGPCPGCLRAMRVRREIDALRSINAYAEARALDVIETRKEVAS